MNGTGTHARRDTRVSYFSVLYHVRTHQEDGHLGTTKSVLNQNPTMLALWSQVFQDLEEWEANLFCLSHPVCSIFVIGAQPDKDTRQALTKDDTKAF